jgi:predicted GNAT family acetyltransferase
MDVRLTSSAVEFLQQTESLRMANPFRTNLAGSLALSVANGSRTYEKCFWWVIANNEDQIVGAALRTAPHGMVLLPMPSEAVQELARSVALHDDALPEVAGPKLIVSSFMKAYIETGSPGSLRNSEEAGSQLLYVLNQLIIPKIDGTMILAGENEYDLLVEWFTEFTLEAGINFSDPTAATKAGLQRQSLYFWVVDNTRVCLAGYAPPVETPAGTVARIGPVFTPPEYRRNGYAAALTAELSRQLLNEDLKVMLYTDANNSISNGIYKRIGFELIDENKSFRFT